MLLRTTLLLPRRSPNAGVGNVKTELRAVTASSVSTHAFTSDTWYDCDILQTADNRQMKHSPVILGMIVIFYKPHTTDRWSIHQWYLVWLWYSTNQTQQREDEMNTLYWNSTILHTRTRLCSGSTNLCQGVQPQPNVIQYLNPDLRINPDSDPYVCWMPPKMLWMWMYDKC